MMWAPQATGLLLAAIATLATASCAPTFYYGLTQTRTYELEREVPVTVYSEPAGATIVSSDGVVLGTAPLIVTEKVRVRRSHRYHTAWMGLLGCLVDFTGGMAALDYWADHPDSAVARAAGLTGAGLFVGCFLFGLTRLVTAPLDSWKNSVISDSGRYEGRNTERVIPRTLEFEARWDGLAAARAQLTLAGPRVVMLRLPRSYTFDEALVLWARDAPPPLATADLPRVGDAYRNLARRGAPGAAARAIEIYKLYLQRDDATTQVDRVRRALGEFRSRGGWRR